MKLTYLLNGRFPTDKAHGYQVAAMCEAFAKAGTEVELLVPDRREGRGSDPFAYYGMQPLFSVQRVPCIDLMRSPIFRRFVFLLLANSFARSVQAWVNQHTQDVIYSRDLAALPKKTTAVRIWEAHTLSSTFQEAAHFSSVEGIVAVTHALKERLIALGYPQERILVEADGVTIEKTYAQEGDRERLRTQYGLNPQTTVLLYTGRFTTMGQEKGLADAIQATQLLRQQGKPCVLWAVGGTTEEIEQFRSQAGEGIELIAHQPVAELAAYYAAADVLILPFPWTEHYAYYMSPLKLFEYLAVGKPIVTTDLPSIRDVLSDGETFFCQPHDPQSMANAVETILTHPEAAQEKAHRAKNLAFHYTWQARAERIQTWVKTLPATRATFTAKPALLLMTQVVDDQHQVLGFFTAWLQALAREWPGIIHVCCWSYREGMNLSPKLVIHPLPQGKIRRMMAMLFFSWRLRKTVSQVFVHMISPVIVAVGWYWKLLGWKIVLWYAHGAVPWELRVSEKLVDRLLTPSRDSLRIESKKVLVTGHGIDLEARIPSTQPRKPLLLCVGRITPRKDQLAFIQLCARIRQVKPELPFTAKIVGEPLVAGDDAYFGQLKEEVKKQGLEDIISFSGLLLGDVLNDQYKQAALFVNASQTGSLDKVVLEALAYETPVLTVGHSYEGFEGVTMVDSLQDTQALKLALGALQSPRSNPLARQSVVEKASLSVLAKKIVAQLI